MGRALLPAWGLRSLTVALRTVAVRTVAVPTVAVRTAVCWMGSSAALGLVALAVGCTPERPAASPADALRPCAEAWASIPEARRGYDWERDPVRTPRGNEGYARFAERLPRGGCVKAWTVLVYMAAGASDLGAPARRDLRAIEAPSSVPSWSAASTAEADVVVQLEAPEGVERLHLFRAPPPSGPQESAPGIQSPIVEAFDAGSLSTEESLSRFASWGVEHYPSERYAIVVWGHGLGWRPASSAAVPHVRYDRVGASGGIAFDDRRGTVLDIPGLSRALDAASRRHLGGRPFDVYASDACLMQSIEVAGELGAVARYVVGSEQIEEDYVSLPYRAWLPLLNGSAPLPPPPAACPTADAACRVVAALPDLEGALAATTGSARAVEGELPAAAREDPSPGDRYTLSVLDEAALERDLLPSLRRLSAAIEAYVREDDLRRIGLQVLLGLDGGRIRGTPAFRGGTRDVGVFLERLAAEVQREPGAAGSAGQRGVLDAVEAARTSLLRVVIAASFGPRYRTPDYAGMAGVSVWLPHDQADYQARLDFFLGAALYRVPPGEPAFRGFLDRIFAPPPH